MRYRLQQMSRVIFRNLREIISLQIINVFFSLVFMEPFVSSLINRANTVSAGIVLVDIPGFKLYAHSFIIYLFILLILGFYYTIQITVYIQLFQQIIHNKKIEIFRVFKDAILTQFVNYNKSKAQLWLLITIFVPFSFFNIFNMAILPVRIPLFVLDVLLEYSILRYLYIILTILVNLMSILLMFLTFEVHINRRTIVSGFQEIFKKIKSDPSETKDIFSTIFVIAIGFFIIYVFISLVLVVVVKALIDDRSLALYEFLELFRILQFIFTFISGILFFSVMVLAAHYLNQDLNDETIIKINDRSVYLNLIYTVTLVLCLAFLSDAKAIHFSENTKIYAHRGGEYGFPENTLPAFDYVSDLDIDGIELDTQRLLSGEYIVTHDYNLKRLTGTDLSVADATYNQIKNLHAGYYLEGYYKGYPASIPLLQDVLAYSDNQSLMIEVKTYQDISRNTLELIELINKFGNKENIMIASMSKDFLQEIKRVNPTIETTFIKTNINQSDLKSDFIDNYSFHIDFLNLETVNYLQNQGKKVYVWTVNNKKSVRKALSLHVDGVVTDDPIMVKETLINPNYNVTAKFWEWLAFN